MLPVRDAFSAFAREYGTSGQDGAADGALQFGGFMKLSGLVLINNRQIGVEPLIRLCRYEFPASNEDWSIRNAAARSSLAGVASSKINPIKRGFPRLPVNLCQPCAARNANLESVAKVPMP